MTKQDWLTMLKILRWRYGDSFLADERDEAEWFNNLLLYPFSSVDRAVRYYCEARDTAPTLDQFLIALEEIHSGRWNDFFRMKSEAFIGCKKCNDRGYYYVVYPSGEEVQEDCDCRNHNLNLHMFADDGMTDNEWFRRFGVGHRFINNEYINVVRRPRIQLYNNRDSDSELANARMMGLRKANADTMAERPVTYEVTYGTGER